MSDERKPSGDFFRSIPPSVCCALVWWVMSVLDDFVRMRLYRNRAAEFEELSETARISVVRGRYQTIARHYKELANREESMDKARMAERLELLRLKREQAATPMAFAIGK